jgi:ABC-type polysaccharide/polyol phosphate export permease
MRRIIVARKGRGAASATAKGTAMGDHHGAAAMGRGRLAPMVGGRVAPMVTTVPRRSLMREGGRFLALVHATTVNAIGRQATGSFGLLEAFAMPVALCSGFLLAYHFIGMFRPPVRGDIVVFLLTGIYLFQLASRTRGAAVLTGGGPLMHHQPVQPVMLAWAGALSSLYIVVVSMGLIFGAAVLVQGGIAAHDPAGLIAPILLAWLFGVGSGMLMSGIARYAGGAQLMGIMWQRAMFLTSGIFFLADTVPGWMRPWFDWNPLFHLIDRMRDAAFVNYAGGDTSLGYPAAVIAAMLLAGHVLERRVRADFSISGA